MFSSGSPAAPAPDALFLERQTWRMNCGVHAVNNFLQDRVFDNKTFDEIISSEVPHACCLTAQLKPLHPHGRFKSRVPLLGNYDASVLVLAMVKCGVRAEHHDPRKEYVSCAPCSRADCLCNITSNMATPLRGFW